MKHFIRFLILPHGPFSVFCLGFVAGCIAAGVAVIYRDSSIIAENFSVGGTAIGVLAYIGKGVLSWLTNEKHHAYKKDSRGVSFTAYMPIAGEDVDKPLSIAVLDDETNQKTSITFSVTRGEW